jgi:hypothetical protein
MTAVHPLVPEIVPHTHAALEERLNKACKQVHMGLRTALIGAKTVGEVMLEAQKELRLNPNGKLYNWVRATTGCTFADTTLANWRRLAREWGHLVQVVGQKTLHSLTVREALSHCKKHARQSRPKSEKPGSVIPMEVSQPQGSEVNRQASGDAPQRNDLTVAAHLAHVVSELDETCKCIVEHVDAVETKRLARLLDAALLYIKRLRKKLKA